MVRRLSAGSFVRLWATGAAIAVGLAACSESTSQNQSSSSAGGATTNGSSVTTNGSSVTTTGSGGDPTGGSSGSSTMTTGTAGTGGAGGSSGASTTGGGGSAGNGTGGGGVGGTGPGGGGASVLQHHNSASRDGVFVDPQFTKAAAARMHMDTTFKPTIQGPTFAQPLYFEGGPGGKDVVIVATTQNRVYALDASTGAAVWEKQVGTPVGQGSLPCGNINPVGIVGTPIIDAPSRTLFFDAMTTPDGGGTKKRLIFGLSIDDGSTRAGWPVDVSATVKAGSIAFDSSVQSERGALALVNGTLYVPYGGHWGDCGNYHGWVVGVPINNPSAPRAYATSGRGGGIWSVGGIASDGTSLFIATGNTFGTNNVWAHGEAVMRLPATLAFSGQTADYFVPSNWFALDGSDTDLGGSNAVVFDVPGANPSQLVAAFGKNGVAYLINRTNLGGIGKGDGTTGEAVASAKVASNQIIQAAAAYRTSQATYLAVGGTGLNCSGGYGGMVALKVAAASPPTMTAAWCGGGGFGSPIVTTTDGHAEAIVWLVGADGNNRLSGVDGDTGQTIFSGLGNGDGMSGLRKFIAPIAAKGRIFIGADSTVYAFTMK